MTCSWNYIKQHIRKYYMFILLAFNTIRTDFACCFNPFENTEQQKTKLGRIGILPKEIANS